MLLFEPAFFLLAHECEPLLAHVTGKDRRRCGEVVLVGVAAGQVGRFEVFFLTFGLQRPLALRAAVVG